MAVAARHTPPVRLPPVRLGGSRRTRRTRPQSTAEAPAGRHRVQKLLQIRSRMSSSTVRRERATGEGWYRRDERTLREERAVLDAHCAHGAPVGFSLSRVREQEHVQGRTQRLLAILVLAMAAFGALFATAGIGPSLFLSDLCVPAQTAAASPGPTAKTISDSQAGPPLSRVRAHTLCPSRPLSVSRHVMDFEDAVRRRAALPRTSV